MKKLLVLVLVLGMVSFCSAAQVWSIIGSTATQDPLTVGYDVNPGDTITATLNLTGAGNDIKGTGVIIDYIDDAGAAGVVTNVSVNANFVNGNAGMSVADLDAMLIANELPASGIPAGDWTWVSAVSGGNTYQNGIMAISYAVGATTGTITISGMQYADTSLWAQNSNIISIVSGNLPMLPIQLYVPEPATIALLCLGGLLLRKK